MKSSSKQSDLKKPRQSISFEEYVKKHGEEVAIPFDDVLRHIVSADPKRQGSSSAKSKKDKPLKDG